MDVSIVTPRREVFAGEALSLVAPGVEGEFGILPGHTPFLTNLVRGDRVVVLAGRLRESSE